MRERIAAGKAQGRDAKALDEHTEAARAAVAERSAR